MTLKNILCAVFSLSSAACALAAPLLVAGTARADALSDLYRSLQSHPRDVNLNLSYAAAAERAGKLKWALPAYERALDSDPGNEAARQGIARVRTRLLAEAGHGPGAE